MISKHLKIIINIIFPGLSKGKKKVVVSYYSYLIILKLGYPNTELFCLLLVHQFTSWLPTYPVPQ